MATKQDDTAQSTSRPSAEPYPGEADAPQASGPSGPAGAAGPPDPLAERRRLLRKSTLDYIVESSTSLQMRLSRSDKVRLDNFLTSVKTLEARVTAPNMPGGGGGGPGVTACNGLGRPALVAAVGNVPPDYNRGTHATLMIDLTVMALQCDITRSVSFMLDDARSDYVYNFIQERQFTTAGSTRADR